MKRLAFYLEANGVTPQMEDVDAEHDVEILEPMDYEMPAASGASRMEPDMEPHDVCAMFL